MTVKQYKYKEAFKLYSKQVPSRGTSLEPVSQLVHVCIASAGFSEEAANFSISEICLCCLKEVWKKEGHHHMIL